MAEDKSAVKRIKKKKIKRTLKRGQAHVQASYNNTIVTITDSNGNAIAAASAGQCGFKGPKKATPYAAGVVVKNLMEKLRETGLEQVDVFIKGVGSGREGAIRALHANGLEVMSIKDMTPIPHNGCRPPKVRRV
ncbi:MAG: 30S ribosomal protein S11 [Candidatus Komeilibacteria bacterium]|nr:30S ribosomal protein S11 [Candidatus Komeilibacteria bacterium]